MFYYLTALSIGLMGSLHCVGMCGPIAIAVPVKSNDASLRWMAQLNYLLGKTITYGFLGIFSGALAQVFEFAGFQQYISLFSGFLILFILVSQRLKKHSGILLQLNYQWVGGIKKHYGKYLYKKSLVSAFLIGVINGLLPCGLVYLAMAGAVGAGGWWQSMFYMMLFGIGTMPLLFTLMTMKNKFSLAFKRGFNRLIPTFTLVLALLLILRGLNLGIPYVSPAIDKVSNNKTTIECCSKPIIAKG